VTGDAFERSLNGSGRAQGDEPLGAQVAALGDIAAYLLQRIERTDRQVEQNTQALGSMDAAAQIMRLAAANSGPVPVQQPRDRHGMFLIRGELMLLSAAWLFMMLGAG